MISLAWLIVLLLGSVLAIFTCSLLTEDNEYVKKILICCGVFCLLSIHQINKTIQFGENIGLENGKKLSIGTSIPLSTGDNTGKTFRPLGIVFDGESVLLINDDHKLYSLLGVRFEQGLNPTNLMTVGTNSSYILYRKGENLYFGLNDETMRKHL